MIRVKTQLGGTRMLYAKRLAFTMLELVMVIVVLGILAALAMPRIDRDLRQDAANTILSSIRYTQHLALMDNKNDRTGSGLKAELRTNWQQGLWHLRFGSYDGGEGWFYTVSSSQDANNNVDKIETALDPASGKHMYHLAGDDTLDDADESPNIFISRNFGINNVDFTNCTGSIGRTQSANTASHIAFDYMGRPHKGIYGATNDYATVMHADCTIRFEFIDTDLAPLDITIEKETGYAFIVLQPNT